MTTPLHCKVCAKPLRGQQRLYCGRPCKRRAYAAKQKLREAQELADMVDAHRANYVFGGSWMGELKELSADDKMLLNKHLVDLYVDDVSCVNVTQIDDSITVIVPPDTTVSTVNAAVAAHLSAPVGKPHSVPKPQPPQIEVIRDGFDPIERDISVIAAPTSEHPSLLRRAYAYIQLLGHTLYHVFDGWRTK